MAAEVRRGVTGRRFPAAAVLTPAVRADATLIPDPRAAAVLPVRAVADLAVRAVAVLADRAAAGLAVAGLAVVGLAGRAGLGAGFAAPAPARATVALPAAVRVAAVLPAVARVPAVVGVAAVLPAVRAAGTFDAVPAADRVPAVFAVVVLAVARPARPAFTPAPVTLFREISDLAEADVAADFAAVGLATDLTAAGLAVDFAVVRFGLVGFGTAGRVVVVVRAVVVFAVREVAAATFFPPTVEALVGAFLAAAIWVFLLANDCGLVSAWRLRIPAWTQGASKPVLAFLPGPAGIVGPEPVLGGT
jgi:hypothetical protein